MLAPQVQGLLGAVRRRLWRGQFVAAVRQALWGTAGLMLLAIAGHLAARQVPVGAVLMVTATLWLSVLVWAGTRRPAVAACALWADRHLGGASAFTTLLETGTGAKATGSPQAVQWLESWAAARVPEALGRLAKRRETAHLSRPLLAMLVCTALTALVLSLPDFAPTPRQQAAASPPSGTDDRAAAQAEPAAAQGVDKLAAALRAASLQQPPDAGQARREGGQAEPAAPGKADGPTPVTPVTPVTPAAQASARPAGEPATQSNPSSGTAAAAAKLPAAGTGNSAGAGTGNEAGDSRDARGDTGLSPVPRGTITVPGAKLTPWSGAAEPQADMGHLGRYDGEPSRPGAASMPALAAAAAATPPPAARESKRLSPAEMGYVQAWMKANAQRR